VDENHMDAGRSLHALTLMPSLLKTFARRDD